MRRPHFATMALGHPWVARPVYLVTGIAGVACWQVDQLVLCGLLLGLACATGEAQGKADTYNRWKRDWDAMSGVAPGPSFGTRILGFVQAVLTIGVLALGWGAVQGNVASGYVLAFLGLTALATMLFRRMWRWVFRRRHRTEREHVSIVAKPIMPALALAQAYARLPAHCQAILTKVGA